ncbi:MAG TPA: translation initiation factor IF-3, partial [Pyrinomonadaceae bacterium]
FRPGTDDHDYNFKMKHAHQWLDEGDKVKATIFFRGREITHRELGAKLLERLEKDLAPVGEVEQRPRMEGNQMFFIFTPKRHKTSKHEGAKAEAAAKPKPAAPPPQPVEPTPPAQPTADAQPEPPAQPAPPTQPAPPVPATAATPEGGGQPE